MRVTFRDIPSAADIVATGGAILDGVVPNAGTCPDCGGALEVDCRAFKGTTAADEVPQRVRVASCSGCEFIIELPRVVKP